MTKSESYNAIAREFASHAHAHTPGHTCVMGWDITAMLEEIERSRQSRKRLVGAVRELRRQREAFRAACVQSASAILDAQARVKRRKP